MPYRFRGMGRAPKIEKRNKFGAWLHHLREQKGLSQDELSKKTGIPQSNLTYWERTGKLKGREEILKLSEALGVSLKKLLRSDIFD